MTILLMVSGSVVAYIAGAPLASYVIAHGNLIMVEGAPGYADGNNSTGQDVIIDGTFKKSEIEVPKLDTQYAMITCGRISLKAPVYYGDNAGILEKGAGQYSDSGLPGEGKPILITGHDGTFFAPLKDITLGDTVSITTGYGEFVYKVVNTKIADKADTTAYDLTQDKEQLILYTCYPFGEVIGDRSSRYFVYCDLISDAGKDAE